MRSRTHVEGLVLARNIDNVVNRKEGVGYVGK